MYLYSIFKCNMYAIMFCSKKKTVKLFLIILKHTIRKGLTRRFSNITGQLFNIKCALCRTGLQPVRHCVYWCVRCLLVLRANRRWTEATAGDQQSVDGAIRQDGRHTGLSGRSISIGDAHYMGYGMVVIVKTYKAGSEWATRRCTWQAGDVFINLVLFSILCNSLNNS